MIRNPNRNRTIRAAVNFVANVIFWHFALATLDLQCFFSCCLFCLAMSPLSVWTVNGGRSASCVRFFCSVRALELDACAVCACAVRDALYLCHSLDSLNARLCDAFLQYAFFNDIDFYYCFHCCCHDFVTFFFTTQLHPHSVHRNITYCMHVHGMSELTEPYDVKQARKFYFDAPFNRYSHSSIIVRPK